MYRIHHTEGLILDGVAFGEANKFLSVFTKDYGLIRASAQGLRRDASRLRYNLQDLTYAHIDLVFGRTGWRIVGASEIKNFAFLLLGCHDSWNICLRTTRLLRRLLHCEEKNKPLYDDVLRAFMFLLSPPTDKKKIFYIEMIVVMRILHHLGYLGDNALLIPYLSGTIEEGIYLPSVETIKSLALREINKSL